VTGVYKIGFVSKTVGLSPSTLRMWEEEFGLLTPERSNGGTRLYSDADIERARHIRRLLRHRGYTLEAIGRIMEEVRQVSPPTDDRVAIENIYLRDATHGVEIGEGRHMAMIQATLRRLVRAESLRQAAMILVAGVKTLTGAHSAGIGLYHWKSYTQVPVVSATGNSIGVSSQPPLPIAEFPRDWQRAIDAREPYSGSDLLRLELPVDVRSRVIQNRARSFHAEQLAIANEMVGILTITSARPGGVGRDAEAVCERLALAAGPAIHYFAHRL
jgi:MerR family transcriptional regulator, heat shock protein HspR